MATFRKTTQTLRDLGLGRHISARIVVSADGKTLTITGSGTDAQGRTVHDVAVYNK